MAEVLKRAEVVREALSWLLTPYHHMGRVKHVGVDCLMLLAEVYEACGIAPRVEPGHYPHDWHLHRSEELYAQGLARYCRRLPDGARPLAGDVGLFRFGRCYSHGAIVVSPAEEAATAPAGVVQVVHAYIDRGVILSRLDEDPLQRREVQWWSPWPRAGA